MSDPQFYRAKEGFGAMQDGELIHVAAGELVRAGHPILKRREDLFEPVENFGRFDVAPPKKRGRPAKAKAPSEPEPEPEEKASESGLQSFRPDVEQATAAPGEKRS